MTDAKETPHCAHNYWPSGTAQSRAPEAGRALTAANRADVKAATNRPWIKTYGQEVGPRAMIRAIIPHTPYDRTKNDVHQSLRRSLAAVAGGFTCYEVYGGWVSDRGDYVEDKSICYEVSFSPAGFSGPLSAQIGPAQTIRQLFLEAGQSIGEEWLHIEVYPDAFFAGHTKLRPDVS